MRWPRRLRAAGPGRAPRASLLKLVLDTLSAPAPALRRSGRTTTRFLRFEGAAVLELQVRRVGRSYELRGQVTPPAADAVLLAGDRERRIEVAADGTFVFRGVPSGAATLTVGDARVEIEI